MNQRKSLLTIGIVGAVLVLFAICLVIGVFVGARSNLRLALVAATTTPNPAGSETGVPSPIATDPLSPDQTQTPGPILTRAAPSTPAPASGNPTSSAPPAQVQPTQPAPPVANQPTPSGALNKATKPNSIGFIGCSNSSMAVEGYELVSSKHLFWNDPNFKNGGATLNWWAADDNRYWQSFDGEIAKFGKPSVVWVNVCAAETPITYAMVEQAVANVRKRAPNATIYISALNAYDPSNLCHNSSPTTPPLRDQAVATGLALRGPDLGPCRWRRQKAINATLTRQACNCWARN